MKNIPMVTLAAQLNKQGVKARVESYEYTKDVHGWLYERTGYQLVIPLPLLGFGKEMSMTNTDSSTLSSERVSKLAAFGLALASLGELE